MATPKLGLDNLADVSAVVKSCSSCEKESADETFESVLLWVLGVENEASDWNIELISWLLSVWWPPLNSTADEPRNKHTISERISVADES